MSENSTSFEGILASIRKRTSELDGEVVERNPNERQDKIREENTQPSSDVIVNSFNQIHRRPINARSDTADETCGLHGRKHLSSSKAILVSTTQTGNPLLKSFANTTWRYVKSTPTRKILYDYKVADRHVIFLSLKYHKLHPEYIRKKLQPFQNSEGNILLCVADIENSEDILKELNKLCIFGGFTMLLAFSFEQAGKYLTFMNK